MKSFISAAVLALVTASAAQAEVKIQTRVGHNYLHVSTTSHQVEGIKVEGNDSYTNGTGIGVDGIYALDEAFDLGLGYTYARYNPFPGVELSQHTISAFGRYNFIKTESAAFYALAGLSLQQLNNNIKTFHDEGSTLKQDITYSPLLNGDVGLGGTFKVGVLDLGAQVKYTNTLSKGTIDFKTTETYLGRTEVSKVKGKGFALEGVEAALTLGLSI